MQFVIRMDINNPLIHMYRVYRKWPRGLGGKYEFQLFYQFISEQKGNQVSVQAQERIVLDLDPLPQRQSCPFLWPIVSLKYSLRAVMLYPNAA